MSGEDVVRWVVNEAANQAVLYFEDGSSLQLEHTSRDNRWAKASAEETQADRTCRSLKYFRLNAKHLTLFFENGGEKEFLVSTASEE